MSTIFPKSKRFIRQEFRPCIETPDCYVLMLRWETLENHAVDFRGIPPFTISRTLKGDLFAQSPHSEHFNKDLQELDAAARAFGPEMI